MGSEPTGKHLPDLRIQLLRDLERTLAEQLPQRTELLAAVRELITEAERETSSGSPPRPPHVSGTE
jgi:hypothetical protein